MSTSRETIDTAYGRVDSTNLQLIQDSYDTQALLSSIDELDDLIREVRGENGLRDMLLSLHAMAHTVVNGAPYGRATWSREPAGARGRGVDAVARDGCVAAKMDSAR